MFKNRHKLATALLVGCLVFVASACELNREQESAAHHLNEARRSVAGPNSTIGINWLAQFKAQAWSEQMAADSRLYHSELRDGMGQPGRDWCGLAENVGYGSTIKMVTDEFMRSPGHRASIVDTRYKAMGVGVARGTMKGQPVVFVTQVFVQPC